MAAQNTARRVRAALGADGPAAFDVDVRAAERAFLEGLSDLISAAGDAAFAAAHGRVAHASTPDAVDDAIMRLMVAHDTARRVRAALGADGTAALDVDDRVAERAFLELLPGLNCAAGDAAVAVAVATGAALDAVDGAIARLMPAHDTARRVRAALGADGPSAVSAAVGAGVRAAKRIFKMQLPSFFRAAGDAAVAVAHRRVVDGAAPNLAADAYARLMAAHDAACRVRAAIGADDPSASAAVEGAVDRSR